MKKFLIVLSVIAVVITITSPRHKMSAQSGDLCGGTGGNGEIVNVEIDAFTLKLNEGGQKGGGNLIVNLMDRTTIQAPTGYVSASDLKIGDRVTLVGDNHGDGTFAANTVVVCSGAHIAVRNKNSEAYEKASSILNKATILVVVLVWLGIAAFLVLKKRKGLVYALFFTVFYIYLYNVLDYTLLQFQSLLLLQHFVPDLMLNGFKDGTNMNFIPLVTLTLEDIKTSLLNILMMLPFGFGLPFISGFRFKRVVVAGLLFSVVIEFLQLITGFVANTTFRVADINDLIFNTIGVAIGYMLFVACVRLYRHMFPNWKTLSNPILRYIAERPQTDK